MSKLSGLKFIASYTDHTGSPRCYYRRAGINIPLPLDRSSAAFREAYDAANSRNWPARKVRESKRTRFSKTVGILLKAAKWRADRKGISFDLTRDWLSGEMDRNGYRCALTGLPFSTVRSTEAVRNPYAPSIDRIDGREGYTASNCRVVLASVNLAINEWGERHFEVIARAYLKGR